MRVRSTQLLRGKPRGAAERCTVASLECEAVQVDGHVDIEHSHVSTQFEAAILQPIAEAPEDHIKVRTLFNRFSPCSPIFGMNGCVYGVGFPKVKSGGNGFSMALTLYRFGQMKVERFACIYGEASSQSENDWVSNHHLSIKFRFHYHSRKAIGSLGTSCHM